MTAFNPLRNPGPYLILAAFGCALFFNGIAIHYLALSLIALVFLLMETGVKIYREDARLGWPWLTVAMMLFWLWLGFSIPFSQVPYLSVVNFWWVGAFPLIYLIYVLHPQKTALWQSAFTLIVPVCVILAFVAIYQFFFVNGQPNGTFFNKNSLGAIFNLLLFPLVGLYLRAETEKSKFTFLVVMFLFAFLLGIIKSRGIWLSFGFAGILLLLLGFRYADKRRWWISLATIIAAFAFAELASYLNPLDGKVDLLARIATLQDTDKAGFGRYVIWGPAWDLFLQHPATGIGLGTYFLAIPPTLHPLDKSAGFYVHNDYLQLALETGLPGAILFVGILVVALWRFIRVWRSAETKQPVRIEFLALSAGLSTVFTHSLFTYNLYILPTMLLTGLMLGRFHQLAETLDPREEAVWLPKKLFRPAVFYLSLGLFGVTLISYFGSLALGSYYHALGRRLAAESRLEQAHFAFLRAQKLTPLVDAPYYADADLLRESALLIPDKPELCRSLWEEAEKKLQRAEKLNPLRPQIPFIRAKLYEQSRPDDLPAIIEAYATALQRNPRYLRARLAMARYLLKRNDTDVAFSVLRTGIRYSYRGLTPTFLNYLALTASTAESVGEQQLATAVSQQLEKYRRELANADFNRYVDPISSGQ